MTDSQEVQFQISRIPASDAFVAPAKDEDTHFDPMVRDGARAPPHHGEISLPVDALDSCDDGLGTQLGDDSAEMLEVIDLEIDGQFGEIG